MNWISLVWHAIHDSSHWMVWNLFLALVPCGLSIWLFHLANRRSILWWTLLLVFFAFLPNAPYVLTDLIHLVRDIRSNDSLIITTLVLLPKYLLFVVVGFEAFFHLNSSVSRLLNELDRKA